MIPGHSRLREDDLITMFTLIKWTEHSSLVRPPAAEDVGLTSGEYLKRRLDLAYRADEFLMLAPSTMYRRIGPKEAVTDLDVDSDGDPMPLGMLGGTAPSVSVYRPWYHLPDPFVFLDNKKGIAYYDCKVYHETDRKESLPGDLIVDESWYTAQRTAHGGLKKTGMCRFFSLIKPSVAPSVPQQDKDETEHDRMYRFFFGKDKLGYP